MKIYQLLQDMTVPLNNEEHNFVESHGVKVKLTSLDERQLWVAQNLVRKGVYDITRDNNHIIRKHHGKPQ